jgi:hypothetical protein
MAEAKAKFLVVKVGARARLVRLHLPLRLRHIPRIGLMFSKLRSIPSNQLAQGREALAPDILPSRLCRPFRSSFIRIAMLAEATLIPSDLQKVKVLCYLLAHRANTPKAILATGSNRL